MNSIPPSSSGPSSESRRFYRLVDSFFEQTISDVEKKELMELLESSSERQKYFAEQFQADYDLRLLEQVKAQTLFAPPYDWSDQETLPDENGLPTESNEDILFNERVQMLAGKASDARVRQAAVSRSVLTTAIALLIAVTGILIGVFGFSWLYSDALKLQVGYAPSKITFSPPTALSTPSREPTTTAVALLLDAVGTTWNDSKSALQAGDILEPGWLRIRSGLISIRFFSGAQIVLEGPAELQILSPNDAYCPFGRITAEVPPQAIGFTINVPEMVVVDRGTSFFLDVGKEGSEVHVLKGAVDLQGAAPEPIKLENGEAASVTRSGRVSRFAANEQSLAVLEILERHAVERNEHIRNAWQSSGEKWNADPELLIHFDFRHVTEQGMLPNLSDSGKRLVDHGIVIGCRKTEGLFPGHRALEFRRVSDRVRIPEIRGEYQSLTLAAWVRADSLDRLYSALFMSNGFRAGNLHWQFWAPQLDSITEFPDKTSKLRLGIEDPRLNPRVANYDSTTIFPLRQFGQWVHIATVIDGSTRTVTHYLDGKPLLSLPFRHGEPLRIGAAELGNWNRLDNQNPQAIRHFNGCIGDFMLFARALAPSEIAEFVDVLGRH